MQQIQRCYHSWNDMKTRWAWTKNQLNSELHNVWWQQLAWFVTNVCERAHSKERSAIYFCISESVCLFGQIDVRMSLLYGIDIQTYLLIPFVSYIFSSEFERIFPMTNGPKNDSEQTMLTMQIDAMRFVAAPGVLHKIRIRIGPRIEIQ